MVGVARTPAHCGEVGCVGGRRDVAERGMRSALIVVSDPAGNRLAHMIEIEEQALVEKFVAHAAVEALAESVLHRPPRRDEMPDDPVSRCGGCFSAIAGLATPVLRHRATKLIPGGARPQEIRQSS